MVTEANMQAMVSGESCVNYAEMFDVFLGGRCDVDWDHHSYDGDFVEESLSVSK